MIQEFRRRTHAVSALVFWMLLLHIEQGFSQTGVLQVDHENGAYSTSADINGQFQISLDGSVSYRLAWRFNEIDICTAAINPGPTLIQASLQCDTSVHAIGSNDLYYASHSEISGSVSGSDLSLDLIYRTAILEESPLRMDVTDSGVTVISNVVSITVQNCTENSPGLIGTSVTESCGFNCNALAVCDSDEEINVICQDDATWRQLKNCTTATTEPSSTATTKSTSSSSTAVFPANASICIGMCFFDYGRNETTCSNQYYNKHSSPAQVINGTIMADIVLYCTGFTAGFIAGITITTVGGVILCSYIVAGFITVHKWTNKLLIPLIATAFWALGIGLSFGLEDGSYDMGGGQIAGCCIGCIATIALGVSCVFALISANKDDYVQGSRPKTPS